MAVTKIGIDSGHGSFNTTPGKRTPDGEYEWDFNNKVALAFEKEILKYKNVKLFRYDNRSGKTDVPLSTRTNKANKDNVDIYISFHHNALTAKWGKWTGVETFYSYGSPKGKKLAEAVQPAVVKAYGLRDRGIKNGNHLWIIRKTKMPAILIEGGFMDSTIDIKKLRNNKVLENAGISIAKAVAKHLGLKLGSSTPSKPNPKPDKSSSPNKTYKVVTSIRGFINSDDAAKGKNPKTTIKPGTYFVFNKSKSMINISTKSGVPGSWINPNHNKKAKSISVGSKVKIKKSASKYATGQSIPSYVKNQTHTVQSMKSDRVLLKEIYSWVKKSDIV